MFQKLLGRRAFVDVNSKTLIKEIFTFFARLLACETLCDIVIGLFVLFSYKHLGDVLEVFDASDILVGLLLVVIAD